ncbi:DUF192 domain-containing protein [Henriciella mobilis]|uniref:DUF192 domain-containing protein n=1 Tax=Henriciella mobilis TaxID=2305467 RepID=UPI000E6632C6|nr:DUF192 domain-containing protein [Henriciella mobilis]RIJ15485.1 DUF192 domain-containing protein [Henriciella mobilis]RIJ18949.1 DUF192 domain-containing protein [Henriciella mobilis]
MKLITSTMTALVLFALSSFAAAMAQGLETGTLTIETEAGEQVFEIEIADEPEEISYGLMNRESLAENAGMLFDFGNPREPAMWMKNTLIPLDMLFISSDGTIQMIARNTVPGSLRTISPGMPVKGVLEINGGRAAALGIEPGDTVNHAIFATDVG